MELYKNYELKPEQLFKPTRVDILNNSFLIANPNNLGQSFSLVLIDFQIIFRCKGFVSIQKMIFVTVTCIFFFIRKSQIVTSCILKYSIDRSL